MKEISFYGKMVHLIVQITTSNDYCGAQYSNHQFMTNEFIQNE